MRTALNECEHLKSAWQFSKSHGGMPLTGHHDNDFDAWQ
jgi:hypothetical protein